MPVPEERRRKLLNTVLIVMVGQVGCVTLLIILASVFAGLWLDVQFGTRPVLTIAVLIAGVPLSVLLMLALTRRAMNRIRERAEAESDELFHV
jgi:hypothetical protein